MEKDSILFYTVSLTNIFGKLLYTSKFYGTSGSIYTSNLCSGIYYISFNFERKKLSKRIIIN
ncbi:MAG: T9SS type A sorting domain-containing protein [Saprospiraceae bacterium]|nr:T9SS type A sorting domain-containing protein [Saprospiraceae bacterium]